MTRSSLRTLCGVAPVAAGLLAAVLLAAGPVAAAGTALHVVPGPSPAGASGAELVSVTAVSPADAWAVGYANVGTTTFLGAPLAEHFDGTRWSIIPTAPVPAADDVRLAGVAFSSASDDGRSAPTPTWPPEPVPASSSTSTAPPGRGCPRRSASRSGLAWCRWPPCPPPTPGPWIRRPDPADRALERQRMEHRGRRDQLRPPVRHHRAVGRATCGPSAKPETGRSRR